MLVIFRTPLSAAECSERQTPKQGGRAGGGEEEDALVGAERLSERKKGEVGGLCVV
jgi:hypothetical protein